MYRRATPTLSTSGIRHIESVRELIPGSLLRGKRAEKSGFVPLGIEDSLRLAAKSFDGIFV
jgi:hypothetical protein